MVKKPQNSGSRWEKEEEKKLIVLANGNTPTRIIAIKLKRSEDAIRAKAGDLGVSLKPSNQSPYNRQDKPK
jgi:hypothetical protein